MDTQKSLDVDDNTDLELIINNWKKIPVIGTSILMDTLPYLMSPWEHWNKIIDTLKEETNETSSENDTSGKQHVEKDAKMSRKTIHNTIEESDNSKDSIQSFNTTGYITEISDNECTSGDISDVDWSMSDDDF